MIKEVIRFPEGVTRRKAPYYPVVVFDENGDEIPEFQGEYDYVRVKILAQASKDARFFHSTWGEGGLVKQEVSRKFWSEQSMIKEVIKWQNGGVMVFNHVGQQIPIYQGKYEEVKEKILRDAPPQAKFFYGDWPERVEVAREEW